MVWKLTQLLWNQYDEVHLNMFKEHKEFSESTILSNLKDAQLISKLNKYLKI